MAIWVQGYKTFFMLNSAEHEILHAHKYKNIKKFSVISGSDKHRILFFLLVNVEMSTIVGNNCWHFNIYEQEKFYAQLS